MTKKLTPLTTLLTLCVLLAACSGSPLAVQLGFAPGATSTPSAVPPRTLRPVTATPSATLQPSPFPPSTSTPTRRPTATQTPLPLPIFTSRLIRPEIAPQTYLPSTCDYLEDRWDPAKAAPGTVVIPIMYHSIVAPGKSVTDPSHVTDADFRAALEYAQREGFQTITSAQLLDFLEHNAPIPERAMLLIVDDRRPGTIREAFMPYLERFDWSVTSAYITGPDLAMEWAWTELIQLTGTGRVDVQAHGYWHNGSTYIQSWTTEEVIRLELEGARDVIQERLGYQPVAFIWPGGNYTPRAVEMAREAGYRLGFTVRARGPLLFNWIPQGEDELAAADFLLTLPRYWSKDLFLAVDTALKLQAEARTYTEEHRAAELEYLKTYCGD